MFLIGKLQTIDGCRLRLPCPAGRLLGVARLTAEFDATTRGWESLIAGHPALLVFCIDRYERQFNQPPSDLKELAKWARQELASQLLVPKAIKHCPPGEGKRPEARSMLRQWRRTESRCDRNGVLFQWMKEQLPPKAASRPIKKWLKRSAKAVLSDRKFDSSKKRLVRRSGRFNQQDTVSLPTLKAFLRVASENFQLQATFHDQLQTEKLAALKQLAYGASHEINNPLANIATGAQALIQSESNPDRRRRLANIYGQSMAAHDMISDLMLFAHPPAPVKESVELRTLIREIAQQSEQRGQEIRVTFGPGVSSATLDRNQIAIMIEALLRNSFEAIAQQEDVSSAEVAASADVSIRVDQTPDCLTVFVTDNGPGFSAQQSRHLFDPFYSGREAGRGLGFGLSKAYRIVKLHGGEIVADRDRKAGETTFMVRLPVVKEV